MCEHIAHPALWVDRVRHQLVFGNSARHARVYGYCCLCPEALRAAIINRVCDAYEWEYLRPEDWDLTVPIEHVMFDCQGCPLVRTTFTLGDVLTYLEHTKPEQ